MQGDNLTYIYGAWLDWSRSKPGEFMTITEIFDESIIVMDRNNKPWMVPFVGSSEKGRAVFGKPFRIKVEYCYYTSESLVFRMMVGETQISRPASGRACLLSHVNGDAICIVTEGYVEDANFSSDITQYTVEEG
jgi:hypothetical protein